MRYVTGNKQKIIYERTSGEIMCAKVISLEE